MTEKSYQKMPTVAVKRKLLVVESNRRLSAIKLRIKY